MIRDENLIILRGTLISDPESRPLPSQTLKITFNLATDESYTDRATKQPAKRTTWHRIVAYGMVAELCQTQLRRGMRAYIKGSLNNWSVNDIQSGKKSQIVEVVAQVVEPLLGNLKTEVETNRRSEPRQPARQMPAQRRPARTATPDSPPTFNPYVPDDNPPFDDYPDDYQLP